MDPETDDPTGLAAVARLGRRVTGVTHDSRRAGPGSLYACLRGERVDGHDFAAEAVRAGAIAVLVDHRLPVDEVGAIEQIVVDDTRLRLGPIAALIAGHPSESLTTVGITGTNGKTTTTHLLAAVFEAGGSATGVIGTLQGPRTTPEAPELQQLLAGFVSDGDRAAVVEVSSHALALHRVDGTSFDAVVFTNLGRDHLDLHGTQEEYFRAKASLFDGRFAPLGVINVDDPYGRLLADTVARPDGDRPLRVVPFSLDDAVDLEVTTRHHRYTWRGHRIDVPIGGRFNVMNSLAALTTAVELGVDVAVAAAALRTVSPVPGRFQVVASDAADRRGVTVVVDYAHTPDGLAEALDSARSSTDDGSAVIVVFGCGGERDQDKRPEMGAVAARLADVVVVTSDNPRHERPEAIIGHIVAGIDDRYLSHVRTEADRRTAICSAIEHAGRGDTVVIAGKGHEQAQDLGSRSIEFDDAQVAIDCLEESS